MILGKKDKKFVEGLKDDIFVMTNDISFLRNLNKMLVSNVVRLTNMYDKTVSIENLLNLSGLSIIELSNISGVNLEDFLDSGETVSPELFNSILRSLFKFFLENTGSR